MKWGRDAFRLGRHYSMDGKWWVRRTKPSEWTLYDEDGIVGVRPTLKECKQLAESRD